MVRALLNLAQEERLKHERENGGDGGTDGESWLNGRLNMSGRLDDTIIRGWPLRVLRMKWGRNEDSIPRAGYIRLAWDNRFRHEQARIDLQARFLVGSRQFTAPYGDEPPHGEVYVPVPLEDELEQA